MLDEELRKEKLNELLELTARYDDNQSNIYIFFNLQEAVQPRLSLLRLFALPLKLLSR